MTFRRYLQAALPAVLAVFFLISCKEKEESLLIDEIETISASDPVNQTEEETSSQDTESLHRDYALYGFSCARR